MSSRKFLVTAILIVAATITAIVFAPSSRVANAILPEQISDGDFWRIVTGFSEPDGFFRSDNFVSNETTFQHPIPVLVPRTKPSGIYIGVGPDQNFTYIAALRPKLAFIVDIRRQNMLQHLMYKALFELSDNRSGFLSRLFGRPVPPDLPDDIDAEKLFKVLSQIEKSTLLVQKTLQELLLHLSETRKFALSEQDRRAIEHVYAAFVDAGPDIRYSYPSQYAFRRFPSYRQLMLETDDEGTNHSYMSSEKNFHAVKQLQQANGIVPIVGDFAGPHALRAVGRYLTEHGATVTAFYTSNVEFYLFQSDDWRKFYSNVAGLPLDEGSIFIRSYFNNYDYRAPSQTSASRSVTLLDSMPDTVRDVERGRIREYIDIIKRSN